MSPSAFPLWSERVHGGADSLGPALHDFSSNSNACGPCPWVLSQVAQCDPASYPDASYQALREQLASFHGVEAKRILIAASASEFIFRVSSWVARSQNATVWLPQHGYGDYTHAALAWGLQPVQSPLAANLVWLCDPSSPLGQDLSQVKSPALRLPAAPSISVLDCAYAPLRLQGTPWLDSAHAESVWQLWSPNKALGLTGIRAAYVVAPEHSQDVCQALMQLCPSWPLGIHGVTLLQTWVQPQVQAWVRSSLATLQQWKTMQIDLLQTLGWECLPSQTPFFCAKPLLQAKPDDLETAWHFMLSCLRQAGIKLRDTRSFGLPGHVRLNVLAPVAQQALKTAWLDAQERVAPRQRRVAQS
jgi:histidinol-phosphate aminotransferase